VAKRNESELSNLEVARYYLKGEFGHIFPEQSESLYKAIDRLRDNEVWRLCEALSIFYRLNSVWWVVNNRNFKWVQEAIPVARIRLTGVGDTPLNRLIHSNEIQNDPLKLKTYLLNYYSKFPDDPEGYNVKPGQKPIRWPRVTLVEYKDSLRLIDGWHRFVEQLLTGMEEVEAYVARPNRPVKSLSPTGGRGTIWLLENLAKDLPQKSDSIRVVAKSLAKQSMFKDEFSPLIKKGPDRG